MVGRGRNQGVRSLVHSVKDCGSSSEHSGKPREGLNRGYSDLV